MQLIFDPNVNMIYRIVSGVFFLMNVVLALFIIFLERDRREATATWAWLLLLFIMPIFGFLLYLFFGRAVRLKSSRYEQGKEIEDARTRVKNQKQQFIDHTFKTENPVVEKQSDLVEMMLTREVSFLSENNHVKTFTDGHALFEKMKQDLKAAKTYIHMEFYILNLDGLGKSVLEILKDKAKEGLEVKLLYDAVGSKQLRKSKLKDLTEAGVEVEAFFHAKIIPFVNFRVNNRNHRKNVVIDGDIGYVGGFNVGDEYLGLDEKMGYWRDTHLRIQGDGVDALQLGFIHDWNSQVADEYQLDYSERYFPENARKDGQVAMQLGLSGPNRDWPQLEFAYLKMIMNAKSTIYMQSPYFVPDVGFVNALRIAAKSGVDIHLMIPNKPDQPFVHWATLTTVALLMYEGVNVYTYENGFIHSKMMVIDGEVASVGSANMDARSFKLNFEVNALIYNQDIAESLISAFKEDLKVSKQLTPERYEQRSNWVKFKQSIAKLVSPIL
ncbi:cardiolipin synthase [Staphylococcus coagulans]|uniref:cardiolipin synthase n=1 Tax=Staphylococcus coagulans TaxID=74706 RepID=UPI0015F9AD23|nr:cardiolipin synthase [Staphylococcus coagulans]MBA8760687.1 cardiolipin synthase [Staphylococcus coagulans]MBA8762675.1 cardiolipin synthase [Staphylococcus coagulans]MBA8769420.1 cardiolipin synthase [Staphylococcus coagulans]